MRRALLFSFVTHLLFVVILVIAGLGRGSAQPPPKVYRIKLVSVVPVPEVKKTPVKERGDVEPPPPVKVKKIKPKKKTKEKKPVKKEVSRRPKIKETAEEKKGVGGIELEGEEFPFPYYLELFVNKIQQNWKNPANDSETSLTAQVYFRITKTGRIVDVALRKASGNFIYDQAAMRAVLASNPLPPLPDGYNGDYLGVTCEIIP